MDIIVQNKVIRINSVQIQTYDESRYNNIENFVDTVAWLKSGVLIVFDSDTENTYELSKQIAEVIPPETPKIVVCWGYPTVSYPEYIKCVTLPEDAYICIEDLAGNIMQNWHNLNH